MPRHHDAAAKGVLLRVKRRERLAFGSCQRIPKDDAALLIEFLGAAVQSIAATRAAMLGELSVFRAGFSHGGLSPFSVPYRTLYLALEYQVACWCADEQSLELRGRF